MKRIFFSLRPLSCPHSLLSSPSSSPSSPILPLSKSFSSSTSLLSHSLSTTPSPSPSSFSSSSSPFCAFPSSLSPNNIQKRQFGGEIKLGEIQQAYTHLQQGRYSAARQCLLRAEEILEGIGLHFSDNERLFVVSMILHVCKRSGDADGLLQAANKYLAQKTAENSPELRDFWKMLYATRLFAFMMKGDYKAALEAVGPLEEYLKDQQQLDQQQQQQQQQQQLHNDLTYLKLTEALLHLSSCSSSAISPESSPHRFCLNPLTLSFSLSLYNLPRLFSRPDNKMNLDFQPFWKAVSDVKWMLGQDSPSSSSSSSSSSSFSVQKIEQVLGLMEARASLLSGDAEETLAHLKRLPNFSLEEDLDKTPSPSSFSPSSSPSPNEEPTDLGYFLTFGGEEEGGWLSEIFPIKTWREQLGVMVCVGDERWEDARVEAQRYFQVWEGEKRTEGEEGGVGRVEEMVEFLGSLYLAGAVEWHLDNRVVAEGLIKRTREILSQLKQDPFSAPHKQFLDSFEKMFEKDVVKMMKKKKD